MSDPDSDISEVSEGSEEDVGLDELLDEYNRTMRSLSNLPELAMRRARLDSVLKSLDIEQAVWWIDQLVRGALWGRSPEMDAMFSCAQWLVYLRIDDDYELLQAMYQAAYDSGRESILYLLRDFPPHRELAAGGRLQEVRLPIDRNITMGEKRWFASGNDRRILDRLLLDNEPLVIQKLLLNPLLQTSDVLTIATRRPTKPELLREVVLSEKWIKEHSVREALVQNPYIQTGMALKLVPTLNAKVLRKLRFATDLHPAICESAKLYVELREHRTAPWGH